jgi:hypothetical protein
MVGVILLELPQVATSEFERIYDSNKMLRIFHHSRMSFGDSFTFIALYSVQILKNAKSDLRNTFSKFSHLLSCHSIVKYEHTIA